MFWHGELSPLGYLRADILGTVKYKNAELRNDMGSQSHWQVTASVLKRHPENKKKRHPGKIGWKVSNCLYSRIFLWYSTVRKSVSSVFVHYQTSPFGHPTIATNMSESKMVEYTDAAGDVQKYSKATLTYTDKELKQESVRTYFKNLKSLANMFAYCSYLGHNGTGGGSFRGATLYDSLTFDGYVKDDNGDYVLDDNTYKFRLYNSETDDYNTTDNIYSSDFDIKDDGTKQRYSAYNQCMQLDDAYEYNSIDKVFTTNPGSVYFIHPNTLQFIVQNTNVYLSLNGFVRDCYRLQGVISENMLNNAKNITSTANMFYNCVNL